MAHNIAFGFVLMVLTVAAVSAQNAYCNLCSDHTLCIYPGIGPACSPRITGGVDATAKDAILKIHNTHRQNVANGQVQDGAPGPQPPAADMRELVWNDEIAAIAQRWADQCSFGHDKCRKVSEYEVGQNVYMSSTTGTPGAPDWKSAIDALYNEVKLFNPAWISPFQYSAAIGHYSQVVWADTLSVGCGYSVFKSAGDPTWTKQYYVCNYGPSGNWIGETMYKKGTACSQCPGSCSTKYPGLCV